RRRDAARGDGVPARAEAQRGGGGPGPHRRVHPPPRGVWRDRHQPRRWRRGPDGLMQDFVLDQLEPTAAVPDVQDLLALVQAARNEADAIREQARAEGFAAGHAEGAAAARAEAQAQVTPALQALAVAADQFAAERAVLADQVEGRAVELAIELAEKVVAGAV